MGAQMRCVRPARPSPCPGQACCGLARRPERAKTPATSSPAATACSAMIAPCENPIYRPSRGLPKAATVWMKAGSAAARQAGRLASATPLTENHRRPGPMANGFGPSGQGVVTVRVRASTKGRADAPVPPTPCRKMMRFIRWPRQRQSWSCRLIPGTSCDAAHCPCHRPRRGRRKAAPGVRGDGPAAHLAVRRVSRSAGRWRHSHACDHPVVEGVRPVRRGGALAGDQAQVVHGGARPDDKDAFVARGATPGLSHRFRPPWCHGADVRAGEVRLLRRTSQPPKSHIVSGALAVPIMGSLRASSGKSGGATS